jgi:hypothetical protein
LAQERIFLDEQIRFSSQKSNIMYVIPLLYRLTSSAHHLSIVRLCQAFQHVIIKHKVLRTAIYFDTNGNIIQHCLDPTQIIHQIKTNAFSIMNLQNDDRHLNEIIDEILNQSDLFDLSKGLVIRCHVLRHYRSNHHSSSHDDHQLINDDMILFSVYHAVFDGISTSIFIRDLCFAYETNCLLPMDENTFQYIDYSVHERLIDMTSSRDFWHSQLEGYNLEHSLSLPVDRHRSSTNQRSGLASIAEIIFDNEISMSFLNYASSHHLTLFQLGLATFYVFLLKLTHGQSDLCIASINGNRYRNELEDLIGMFVATLPYRIEVDCHWSFDEVVKHVREKCLSILGHSHYSLQHILGDFRVNQSNVAFLETMFDFITVSVEMDNFSMNGTYLEEVSIDESSDVAKFDFSLTFVHKPLMDGGGLSCDFVCSRDLYDEITVTIIAQRFQNLFEQVFRAKSISIQMSESITSINKLSLILPKEAEEIEIVKFCRMENIVNEGM